MSQCYNKSIVIPESLVNTSLFTSLQAAGPSAGQDTQLDLLPTILIPTPQKCRELVTAQGAAQKFRGHPKMGCQKFIGNCSKIKGRCFKIQGKIQGLFKIYLFCSYKIKFCWRSCTLYAFFCLFLLLLVPCPLPCNIGHCTLFHAPRCEKNFFLFFGSIWALFG